MKYVSTRASSSARQHDSAVSFSEALFKGLADDGGLLIPESFPKLDLAAFRNASASTSAKDALSETAIKILSPFLEGDRLHAELKEICDAAFNFPTPLRFRKGDPEQKTAVLELFHGPTAAFKDIGARFLAECIARTPQAPSQPPVQALANRKRTVIVATSGDTGGAVAAAFSNHPDIDVYVLFPKGRISKRQEKQIACWGPSIKAFAVRGTFDDCQRIVKEALSSPEWRTRKSFISANSISIGRLLPQMTYYAHASLQYEKARGRKAGFVIPTGNLGNASAALWAKKIGFPIGQVLLSTNANHAVHDYFVTGQWRAHPSIETLANAMDVGNPSNMERVLALYPTLDALKEDVDVVLVSDEAIRNQIRKSFETSGEILCPHTATAFVAHEKFYAHDWILVSTAHAAKFETIVEPLIGQTVEIPHSLAELLTRESIVTEIEPELSALPY